MPAKPGTSSAATSGLVEKESARGLPFLPAPSTAAPAPSPNSTQVARSDQSRTRLICSAATTRTRCALPRSMKPSATSSAKTNPAQAPDTSKAAHVAPRRSATTHAWAGSRWSPVVVEQITRSSSDASTPAASRARQLALTARSSSVSVVQTRRFLIPVREKIHSSEVSRKPESSSFETERAGSADPVPRIWKDKAVLLLTLSGC